MSGLAFRDTMIPPGPLAVRFSFSFRLRLIDGVRYDIYLKDLASFQPKIPL